MKPDRDYAFLLSEAKSYCDYGHEYDELVSNLADAVMELIKTGKWSKIGAEKRGRGAIFLCSCCRKTYPYVTNYCPNCGAKMDGGDDA